MEKTVYYYATCMGQSALQDSALSALKLLRHFDVEVIYKQKQTCCGQPPFNAGYFEESKKIAQYNMDLFKDRDIPILVPAGSCAGMMAHEYAELFKHDKEMLPKVQAFGKRVMDVSQYLDQVLNVELEDKGEPINVTFHTSCHALRIQQCVPNQKNLIKKLKNVNLVELEYSQECCGFGGTFSVKEPEISNAIVGEKIKNIKKTNCQYVLVADAGCFLNISGALKKRNENIQAIHLYDFIVQRIGA